MLSRILSKLFAMKRFQCNEKSVMILNGLLYKQLNHFQIFNLLCGVRFYFNDLKL